MYIHLKYILLILCIVHIHGDSKPKIIQAPSDVYGLLNQQISLRCESSDNNDNISWIKDEKVIQSDSKLFVFLLNLDSEGYYACNISNKFGWIMPDKALVRVAYLQPFPDQNNTEQYASPGATVLLQCPAIDGLPRPSIDWQSNNSLSDPRFKLGGVYDLRIDAVKRSDSGLYWCRAKNLAYTRINSPIRLVVIQKPVFLLLPKNLRVVQGSSVLFHCLVTGESPLLVHWYKLSSSSLDYSLSRASLASNCSLLLPSVRLMHTGDYVARATNRAGITEIVFKLLVISQPSFVDTPENVRVSLGQSVFLTCSATGTPVPRIFWYHDDEYLVSESDGSISNSRITIFENGTLSIASVRSRDAGRYECYAASMVGVARSHSSLLVDIPANMFAPVISVPPNNVSTVEGATTVLTCRVLEPHAIITWYKQSLRIMGLNSPHGRHHLLSNGALKISNCKIQDSAIYTCRASLGSLYSNKSAHLSVKSYSEVANDFTMIGDRETIDRPNTVVNISVEFIGDTYLLIKWDVVTGRHSPLFRVEVAAQFVEDWVEVAVTKEPKVLINNLRPDTGYKVLVRGSPGTLTLLKDVVYTLDKPTIAFDSPFVDFHKSLQDIQIFSVKLSTVSSSQLHVSWKVRGGSILRSISGFIIKTEPVSIKRCLLMTQKLGQSLFSCLDNVETVDIDDLINKYDDKQLTASLKVQKFVVQRSIDRDRTKSSAIIGGLRPFVCYEVEIETYIDHMKAGRISGRDSSTKTVLTYDDLPARAPFIKKYQWVDNVTFLVSWDKLDTQYCNGPITGYIVQLINMVDRSLQTFKVSLNELEYKVRLVSPQHQHIFYLSANSCRGPGPRSLPVFIQHNKGGQNYSGQDTMLHKPWLIALVVVITICIILIIIIIISIHLCKKQRSKRNKPKPGQIALVSSAEKGDFYKKKKGEQLLSNYDTLSPNLMTSSDGFSCEHCPSSGTTTIPRLAIGSDDHKSLPSNDGSCQDSLAYASSSIIYKGCQHYNQTAINMFPPNFYGPYIDILNDQRNQSFMTADTPHILNPLIPPPPLYPPPPAPKNQRNYSDKAAEVGFGNHNNTQSSGSASACGSSNKSNKTRKSRTPQSVNQSLHSSSSSKSQKNQPKCTKSNRNNYQNNSSPSIASDFKKRDSQSNSTNSSQKTGALTYQTFVPTNHSQSQLHECLHDDPSELVLTSEISESDTAPCDMEADEQARDTDSLRVMYKLPVKRAPSPDYSTDSSYPYSLANHYSSAEPTFPKCRNTNLPTKF